ncbi:MAG: DUF998 domain-containing protein [Betaproteobacteria bacterium]
MMTLRDERGVVMTRCALQVGVAVPFLYYGTQLLAAPFYPGYSFATQAASMLGSDQALYPSLFNTGAIVVGIASLIASFGFVRALLRLHAYPALAWLAGISIAVGGVIAIKAGLFPLPDPRHGSGPLMVGALLTPVLLLAALWTREDARGLKIYLVATNVLILLMIPVMSGITGWDTKNFTGALQRIATLALYPPIGITAWRLARMLRAHPK